MPVTSLVKTKWKIKITPVSNYSVVGVGCAVSKVCQADNDRHDVTVAQSVGYEHVNWIVIDAMMVMCGL